MVSPTCIHLDGKGGVCGLPEEGEQHVPAWRESPYNHLRHTYRPGVQCEECFGAGHIWRTKWVDWDTCSTCNGSGYVDSKEKETT